jgi:hypothetical protein
LTIFVIVEGTMLKNEFETAKASNIVKAENQEVKCAF